MSSTNRKRYIFDYQDGLHRFIHSGNLVIHNKHRYASYVGFGNYLYGIQTTLRDIGDVNDPKSYNIGRSDYCIALIDRDNKRICISDKAYCSYNLTQAVPDGWEITYVNGPVYDYYFYNKHHNNHYSFCKAVCEYIVNKIISSYVDEYAVLYKYKQTINKEDCIPSVDSKYKETIKLLLDKYNLAEFWFYDKPIIDRLSVYYYQGWSKKVIILPKIPTIKDIYENKVFSKDEQTYIKQRKFYTDFCRGFGISFNEVVKHWEDKNGISVLLPVLTNKYLNPTWREAIIANAKYKDKRDEDFVTESIAKSKENKAKAVFDYISKNDGSKDLLTAWRNNNVEVPFNVTYYYYKITNHASKGRYYCAKWIKKTEQIYDLPFDYVQLKYDANKKIIITSKGAKVRLNDAISLWKLYKQTLKSRNIEVQSSHNDFIAMYLANRNIKCGLYNVTGIYHNLKRYNGDNKAYYEWNVIIGCHTIWIDDFINFVEYYKLQQYFPK